MVVGMAINHGAASVTAGAVTAAGGALAAVAKADASKTQDLARDGWYIVPLVIAVIGFLVLIAVLASWGYSVLRRRWASRPPSRRARQRQAEKQRLKREADAEEAQITAEKERADEAERNKQYRTAIRMRHPAPAWGPESVDLWLYIPHNDTYADHVGQTAQCEVWRSAYVYRSPQLPFDADHGAFTTIFPAAFGDVCGDPWRMNPESPAGFGGRRDGEYVVVWRNQDGEAVASTSFWYWHGRYYLSSTGAYPAKAGWNSGMGIPIS
jgi:hypothetical protein